MCANVDLRIQEKETERKRHRATEIKRRSVRAVCAGVGLNGRRRLGSKPQIEWFKSSWSKGAWSRRLVEG
jgi:hypothetical protein